MPEVDQVIAAPFRHGALQLRERWRIGRELERRGYEAPSCAAAAKSALFLLRPDLRRIGWSARIRHGLEFHLQTVKAPMLHYARLAGGRCTIGLPVDVWEETETAPFGIKATCIVLRRQAG
jgi:heptosyltransferase-2